MVSSLEVVPVLNLPFTTKFTFSPVALKVFRSLGDAVPSSNLT